MDSDVYLTLAKPSKEVLFKDRKSKFYGYAYPIASNDAIKPILEKLKYKHPSANHFCYAWQLGVENPSYRANDDGEPNNSAGMPIYGQIQSYELTNVLVVVVRVFGGTKLGVGGLIQAYRETARIAIEASTKIALVQKSRFQISFEYPLMNQVMRIVKQQQLQIIEQKMDLSCEIILGIRKSLENTLPIYFEGLSTIEIIQLD